MSAPVGFGLDCATFWGRLVGLCAGRGAGPLESGETFELILGSDRLVAKSGGDVNVTAGSSHVVNDAGGDVFLKVCYACVCLVTQQAGTSCACSASADNRLLPFPCRPEMARTLKVVRVDR